MNRFFLSMLLALSATTAQSTTYFVADCGTGAGPGCTVGADSNAGTGSAAPWRTAARFAAAFNAALPGDQFLFAQCGAWNNVTLTLHNAYSALNATQLALMAANRITVSSYAPPWCTTGAKPILNSTSAVGDMILNFTAGSSGTVDGGYNFTGLWLKGKGLLQVGGVSLFRWPRNVTFDNMTVSDFGGGGITCGGQAAYAYPDNIVVRNSTVRNVGQLGIGFFGCPNTLIENTLFDGNGFDNVLTPINHNHQAYVSGTDANNGSVTRGVVIRNNTFINSSIGTDGRCQSAVIVGHDVASDWNVSNNTITQAAGTNSGGCWGISLSPGNGGYVEVMDRVKIDGNKLTNVGNVGINVASCRDCDISNNSLVWTTPDTGGVIGIRWTRTPVTPITAGTRLSVRNNSIYMAQSTDVSVGISVMGDGTGHSIVSNLVYYGPGANIAANCFETDLPAAAFSAFDYNACYHGSAWAPGFATLAAWRAAKGFDMNSTASDPLLAALPTATNPALLLQGGSPLIAKGHPTKSTGRDVTTCKRSAVPGIGAFEYFAAACGTKPAATATRLR